jgi:DNA-binding transcriptional regulator YiaG
MTSAQFRAAIAALGLSQGQAAEFLGVALRTVSGWAIGEYRIPEAVAKLLRVMVDKKIAPAYFLAEACCAEAT